MKLGFITSILESLSFEEMIDFAAAHGFRCAEVACWPKGKAERRYAGVTHIDVEHMDDAAAEHIKSYCEKKGVAISALAYYPNTLEKDPGEREAKSLHI